MNIYSVLDSDDEETPKVKTQKAEKVVPKKTPFEAPVERDAKAAPKKDQHTRHGAKDHHHPDANTNPRKRVFDRKSGTGRGKEVAKGGAGGANWGNDKLEALKAEKHIAGDAEVPEEAVEETEEAAVEQPEPEPTVFTLDEYNRRRAEQSKNSEAFGAVQLREVSADFAGLKTKEADTQEDFIALGAAKAAKAKKEQRSTSKTVVLDVAFTAAPSEQPERERRGERGEGRGGRGEGRGRGGEGRGDRGDRPRSGRGEKGRGGGRGEGRGRGGEGRGSAPRAPRGPKVDFNDANAFPSL